MVESAILTPDQRIRVFVSSTLVELAEERRCARQAIEQLHLTPVMFEAGARPYPPRSLYLAYLRQSHVFVGIYGEQYGWTAPGMAVSGLEDELANAAGMPMLIYVRTPAPDRDPRPPQRSARSRIAAGDPRAHDAARVPRVPAPSSPLGVMARRPFLAAAACVLALTACGSEAIDELCALGDLPAGTPAEIDVLEKRASAVLAAHEGEVIAGTGRNQRIFRAVTSLQLSAQHETFIAEASSSGLAGLASEFSKDFGRGSGFTLTDLSKAQQDLRTACRD